MNLVNGLQIPRSSATQAEIDQFLARLNAEPDPELVGSTSSSSFERGLETKALRHDAASEYDPDIGCQVRAQRFTETLAARRPKEFVARSCPWMHSSVPSRACNHAR